MKDDNNRTSSQTINPPEEVKDSYKLLEEYGFKTPTSQPAQQTQQGDVVDQLLQLKKQLDKAKAILGSGEGVNASSSEELEEIKKAGERAAALTQQLLAFSRRQAIQPEILNLNAVVTDVDKMLRRLIGEDIELVTITDPNLGSIKADRAQIEQVIMNLAVNARDAMPEGGRIVVKLEERDGWPVLAVSVIGVGTTTEMLLDIFEPFVSYGKPGSLKAFGTGLGLFVAREIVLAHGGDISVRSIPAKGTTFKVRIPFMPNNPAAHASATTANSAPTFQPL